MVNAASVLGFARLEATARVGKSCRARAGVSSGGCRGRILGFGLPRYSAG